ncbi:hypothetical protein R1flu_000623 [Riccia fluitans]|uniref:Uncharacterized protein n=1 Tax=Riccia fluitans TaxID=41844 RepID=A0ABD1Y162_9MARC
MCAEGQVLTSKGQEWSDCAEEASGRRDRSTASKPAIVSDYFFGVSCCRYFVGARLCTDTVNSLFVAEYVEENTDLNVPGARWRAPETPGHSLEEDSENTTLCIIICSRWI